MPRREAIDIMKSILARKQEITEFIYNHILNKVDELLDEEANDRYIKHCGMRIQQACYDALSNPYTIFGKKRLLREFDTVVGTNQS